MIRKRKMGIDEDTAMVVYSEMDPSVSLQTPRGGVLEPVVSLIYLRRNRDLIGCMCPKKK